MEDCYMGKATEPIFLPLLRMMNPEIVDIHFPFEGVFHSCVIVSIKKKYPGHAKKIMNAVWGLGQMMYTKMVIVVDDPIKPSDVSTVMWKVFNNIDGKRDIVINEGPLDTLDHAAPLPYLGSRVGIDATKKWESEGHMRPWPDDIEMSEDVIDLVSKRWSSYGL
jgi:4-hydroxy-3-polyprenylbenzoate decarboxylase